MFYHASPTAGIRVLEPRVSNDHIPLVYFSRKRENVLVYLSNAVEKYCRETGFPAPARWAKWASYGFNRDGTQRIEEYYPGALADTYRGVSGYIYTAEAVLPADFPLRIPDAAASSAPVPVTGCEFVPDAEAAILEAERQGLLTILRYGDSSPEELRWIETTMAEEYAGAEDRPDYRHFIEGKFGLRRKL